MYNIRLFRDSDKKYVERICVDTASKELTSSKQKIATLLFSYCNYYITNEKDSCFVATNSSDEPIGYLLCAKNFDIYKALFTKNELEKIKNINLFNYVISSVSLKIYDKYKEQYPAHLHIDILELYQHKGIGKELINALIQLLRSSNIPGVMLIVDSANTKAINFYTKLGFNILKAFPSVKIMGLKTNE